MAKRMSDDERRAFLLGGTRTGVLATVRSDGRPHAAPLWFTLDGDDVVFTTGEATVKGRNLLRDGRATIVVDDGAPPFRFVIIEGRVDVVGDDPAELLRWTTILGARYMGEDRGAEYGRRNAVPSELLVRLRPDKIIASADIAE